MTDKAILWDFDGTLGFREGLWGGCLERVLAKHEPEAGITRDEIRPLLKDGFPWHRPHITHAHLDTPEAWWEVVEGLLGQACISLGFDEARASLYARETHETYLDVAGFQLFDDTIPALTSLRAEGWHHVILSNHVPELRDLVEGLRLHELVDEVLSSAVIGFEKPHPMAFQLAREAAGNPDEIWMVGDNFEADIRGAERVGIPAILVRTTHPDATRQVQDLASVAPLLG